MKTIIKIIFSMYLLVISSYNLAYANIEQINQDTDYNSLIFNIKLDKEILFNDHLDNINFYDSSTNVLIINISKLDYYYFQNINPFYSYRIFNLEFDIGQNLVILVETPLPSIGSALFIFIIMLLILK